MILGKMVAAADIVLSSEDFGRLRVDPDTMVTQA